MQAYRSPARTSIAAQKTHSSNTQGDFPQVIYLTACGRRNAFSIFRICIKPPTLQSQAQEVQWGLSGHDDGGPCSGSGERPNQAQLCTFQNLLKEMTIYSEY